MTRVIELDPQQARWFDLRGQLRSKLGQCERATEDFSHAISIEPRNVKHWVNRARTRESLQTREFITQAVADYSQAIELAPQDVRLLLLRALAHGSLGEIRETWSDLDGAAKLDQVGFIRAQEEICECDGDSFFPR